MPSASGAMPAPAGPQMMGRPRMGVEQPATDRAGRTGIARRHLCHKTRAPGPKPRYWPAHLRTHDRSHEVRKSSDLGPVADGDQQGAVGHRTGDESTMERALNEIDRLAQTL